MSDIPDKLRPYVFHGVRFMAQRNNECMAVCPFCDRPDGKFSVNVSTGQWRCFVCGEGTNKGGGNVYTFIRRMHEMSMEATDPHELTKFAEKRKLLDAQPMVEWGVCKSIMTNNWLIPGYNVQRQMVTLYQYIQHSDASMKLLPTPTLGHHIMGLGLWSDAKPVVYVCEGPWDGMVLWECLCRGKNSADGIVATASRNSSLASQANVFSIPGCETFFESWLALFKGRIVNIMLDSDHPRKNLKTGHVTTGAGWHGTERIVRMIYSKAIEPQEVNVLTWGPDGYDPEKKSGYDLRDYITSG